MVSSKSADERKLKIKANEFLTKGKYKKALPLFLKLSQLRPRDLRMKTKVGDLLRKLDRRDEATAVYRNVAAQYAKDGMLIQAIAVNKMILQINPRDSGIRSELAALYSRRQGEGEPIPLARIATVVQPIQFREIGVVEDEVGAGQAELELPPLDRPAIDDEHEGETIEIPGRIIEFSDAVDLGAIAELALPPTPLFSDLSVTTLEEFLRGWQRRDFKLDELVCREGEPGDSIFIVSEGDFVVVSEDAGGKPFELARLREGDFFGEFGYFSDRKRHATVRAESDGVLLELDRAEIDKMVEQFSAVGEVLQKFYQKRLLHTLLAKSRIFRTLSREERHALSQQFTEEDHEAGSTLMREGEDGDAMFLIQQGRLAVRTRQNDKMVQLATLGEGNFCGEFSVLTGAKRTADVLCLTPVKLLRLGKTDAQQILAANRSVSGVLNEMAAERVEGTIRAITAVSTTLPEEDTIRQGLV